MAAFILEDLWNICAVELSESVMRQSVITSPNIRLSHHYYILLFRDGGLDVFMMDRIILDYYRRTAQDNNLVMVEKPFAQEAYAIGLPKHSPLTSLVSNQITRYEANASLEEMHTFWLERVPGCRETKRGVSQA